MLQFMIMIISQQRTLRAFKFAKAVFRNDPKDHQPRPSLFSVTPNQPVITRIRSVYLRTSQGHFKIASLQNCSCIIDTLAQLPSSHTRPDGVCRAAETLQARMLLYIMKTCKFSSDPSVPKYCITQKVLHVQSLMSYNTLAAHKDSVPQNAIPSSKSYQTQFKTPFRIHCTGCQYGFTVIARI